MALHRAHRILTLFLNSTFNTWMRRWKSVFMESWVCSSFLGTYAFIIREEASRFEILCLFNGLCLEHTTLEILFKPVKLIGRNVRNVKGNWSRKILVFNTWLCFLEFGFELILPGHLTSHLFNSGSLINLRSELWTEFADDVRRRKHALRFWLLVHFERHNLACFLHFTILDLLFPL